MMKILTCIGVLLAFPSIAFAEHGGSLEDQMACTPDVYRLCTSQIPNEDAIVACLNRHKAVLSAACLKVFSRPEPGAKSDQSDDE